MKRVVSLSLLVAFCAFIVGPSVFAGDAKTVTSDFKVEGMTCGGCESGVKVKVKKLEGVENVTASHKEGTASVTYDASKCNPEAIIAAIKDLGFSAELVETKDA